MPHIRRLPWTLRPLAPWSRLVLLVGAIWVAMGQLANAETSLTAFPSFRVETDIFEGASKTPESQHLILFDAGVVYDIPVGMGAVISVFDAPRGRVVLIHKGTRVRTSISTDSLVQKAAQIRAEVTKAGSADKLGLNAKVVTGEKPDSYVIEFNNNRYEATAQKVSDPVIAAEFASFTAWASRLNIARHLGSPPFARITLGDYLAAENAIPRHVKLDVRLTFKTQSYRSEHLVIERLSELDRQKIAEAGGMVATFQEVSFADFPEE